MQITSSSETAYDTYVKRTSPKSMFDTEIHKLKDTSFIKEGSPNVMSEISESIQEEAHLGTYVDLYQ